MAVALLHNFPGATMDNDEAPIAAVHRAEGGLPTPPQETEIDVDTHMP